jgi:hypothetical protein
MSPSNGCALCEAASFTTRYHEDDQCWIADCLICRVPMVVWRLHGSSPPPDVREALLEQLTVVADSFFAGRAWHYDDHMRRIPDHYHGHARAR